MDENFDKKSLRNFLGPDSERERSHNIWMMTQPRSSAPSINAAPYRGFYPLLGAAAGAAAVSPIRHILPQIPTRASNPRTAVSKASLREPFPNIQKSDPMLSGILPGDPSTREVIWREDFRDAPGHEGLDQGELTADSYKFALDSTKGELTKDAFSPSSVKLKVQHRNSEENFDGESELFKGIASGQEAVRTTESISETRATIREIFPKREHKGKSHVDRNSSGVDYRKGSSASENETSDGCAFPPLSGKTKEVVAPANPIKLKIRCDFKEGHKELMAAVVGKDSSGTKHDASAESMTAAATGSTAPLLQVPAQQQPSPQGLGLLGLAPPSPQTVPHLAAPVPSPSMNIVRPKTGRAKTNAELKKQLMEKRAVQYLKGQGDGGSQASSPATSHVDVNSPASVQADAPSPLSLQAEGLGSDILDTLEERSSTDRRSQESKTKKSGASADAIDSQNVSTDLVPVDTKWVVGDMLWARVSGHPWWPCIVSPDPFQQIFTKVISRGQKISFRQYHVQFFGEEGERGWVQESSAIPFEGRTKFDNFCQDMIKEHKKEKKNYTVALNRRRAWEVAVSSAEHARTMPRVRRVEEYVVVYDDTVPAAASTPAKESRKEKDSSGPTAKAGKESATKTKSATKQHRKSSIDDPPPAVTARSSETGSPPRKKQKLSDPSREESPSHIKLPKNISNQCIVQFTVFCQKRRESVKNEHPDYDDSQVEDCLQEQWSKLDDETRSRFIPMGSDFTYLSQMMASVGMPKAPSGIKRSSRFVKSKKPVTSEKPEKPKSKESVAEEKKSEEKKSPVKEEPAPEERRSQRQRVSAEQKQPVEAQKRTSDAEPPKSRRSQNVVNGKASEADVSSPAASPVGQTLSTGIPLKKRGRKSRDYTGPPPPPPSNVENAVEEPDETDSAKKVSTPTVRKEAVAASKPVAADDEDKDTEEEFDDANVCFVCEKATKGIEQCQGPCHGLFHPSCQSGTKQTDDQFQCSECTTDDHKCFICKQLGQKTLPCSVGDCGRFYHEDCLKTLLPDGVGGMDRPLSCPLHSCFTCQLKKQDKASNSDDDSDFTDLFVCVRCPTAYHMTDSCLSAGSLGLTGKYIVCSKHFEPSKTHSLHTRTSSSWCFICEKGGSLLFCDSCPAAYHTACLDMTAMPSGAWQCPGCSRGKSPLYGDLVWVKFGSYRWWPAEIYHPSSLPLNIQDLPHQVGEFPVCFFGSHDYLWIHRGRVFPFKEGDKCCREADAKGTAKIFDKAMKEAIAVYRMLNPNSKHPASKSPDEEDNAEEKPVSRKRRNADDQGNNEDVDDYDGDGVQNIPKTSTKATPPSDRRAKRSKTKTNSKVLRQMQRQSQVLRLIEPPRLTEDGSALKMVNDHESACYRCGRLGQLILCDKPKCTKAYHMKCIHKSKLPHGMWLCPWHHCDVCGKAAIQFCSRCPNSYCADHVVKNIIFSVDHGMTCFGHPDVTRGEESMEVAPQFVPLNPLPAPVPRQQSRSKDLGDSTKKKRRTKTVPPLKKKLAVSKRVVEPKSTGVGSDSDSRSDDAPLTIVEDPDPVITKSSKKVKKAKPVTKSRKSDGAGRTKESVSARRSPNQSAPSGQADNDSQRHGGDLATPGRKSLTRADSPMFDNSDDEFPQLVIDVPTL